MVVALLALMRAVSIHPCLCGGPTVPKEEKVLIKEAVDWASVVFVGTVTEYKDEAGLWRRLHDKFFPPDPAKLSAEDYVRLYGFETTFKIETSFKGNRGTCVKVLSGRGNGDCGHVFTRGERYLVYARRDSDGRLLTSICTRTKPVALAREAVAYLAQGLR